MTDDKPAIDPIMKRRTTILAVVLFVVAVAAAIIVPTAIQGSRANHAAELMGRAQAVLVAAQSAYDSAVGADAEADAGSVAAEDIAACASTSFSDARIDAVENGAIAELTVIIEGSTFHYAQGTWSVE